MLRAFEMDNVKEMSDVAKVPKYKWNRTLEETPPDHNPFAEEQNGAAALRVASSIASGEVRPWGRRSWVRNSPLSAAKST